MSEPNSAAERQRIKKLRDKARRKIKKLLEHQHYKCYWCGKELARIYKDRRDSCFVYFHGRTYSYVRKTNDFVEFLNVDGISYKEPWATVDHILAIKEGGDSTIENLCAACPKCNQERTKEITVKDSHCECGAKKEHRKNNYCGKCNNNYQNGWLCSFGWVKSAIPDMWVDPVWGSIVKIGTARSLQSRRIRESTE
ncbi:HNH endonuclease [Candidatus Parcubacteria bacterium]|nr:MAG: HNH endonuclease [Candidatus Parcubacteria bacterium]